MRRYSPFIVLVVAIGAVVWGVTRIGTGAGGASGSRASEPAEPDSNPGDQGPLADLSFDPEHPLGGRVVTPEGRPVAEAEVEIFLLGTRTWLAALEEDPHLLAVTAEDGYFYVPHAPAGDYAFLARAEGSADGLFVITGYVEGEVRRVVIPVSPLAEISGRVENEHGLPVVGARVRAEAAGTLRAFVRSAREFKGLRLPEGASAETNGEGRYVIEGLQPSVFDLLVEADGFVDAHAYTVAAPAGGLTIPMRAGVTVRGTVKWRGNAAPESIDVRARPDGPRVSAVIGREAATFELPNLAPGDYVVIARAPHFGIASADLHVEVGATSPDIDLELIHGTEVKGRVQEEFSGDTIANATVIFTRVERDHRGNVRLRVMDRVRTDAHGHYELSLPPGRWMVRAEAAGHMQQVTPAWQRRGQLDGDAFDVGISADSITRNLKLRAIFAITGRVLYPDGTPAPAFVGITGATGAPGSEVPPGAIPRGPGVQTDHRGHFRIEGAAPFGVYEITASFGRDNKEVVENISFAAGSRRAAVGELTIERPPPPEPGGDGGRKKKPADLIGRIVDYRKQPVPHALVSIDGILRMADREGRFQLLQQSPGEKSVQVVAPSLLPATLSPIYLEEGEVNDVGPLVVPHRGGIAMGTVSGLDRVPVYRARLGVTFSGVAQEYFLETNAQGRFELAGPIAPLQRVTVRVTSPGYVPHVETATIVGTAVLDIELEPSISVTIEIFGDRRPDSGITMAFGPTGLVGRHRGVTRRAEPTGKVGVWAVRGVPAGAYRITVAAPGGASIDLGDHVLEESGGHHLGRFSFDSGGTILGMVKDRGNKPVAGAVVRLDTNGPTATSDANGKFAFYNVGAGTHRLTATYAGGADEPAERRNLKGKKAVRVRNGRTETTFILVR